MCTKPRIIVPGVYYQIYSRGVFGENIFPNTELKNFFLKELAITLKKFSYCCCSWSLQENHYHLVVKSSEVPISKFMQRLNSVYAKKYNRERGREGVVFFRRYASIISEETELKNLIRYVHLNPVRCGACTLDKLDDYEWCGHRAALRKDNDDILDRNELLNQFSDSDPVAQYRKYLLLESSDSENNETVRKVRAANRGKLNMFKPESWVIGSPDFIRMVLEKDRCRRAQIARHCIDGTTLDVLHGALQLCLNSERDELFHQGRINQKSTSRELFAYLSALSYDFKGTEIADYLKITASGVSRMISRCSRICQKDYLVDSVCGYLPATETVG